MPLTHTEIVGARPCDKRYRLSDGPGKAARERLDEVRHKLDPGIDPFEERKGNGETAEVTVPGNRLKSITRGWFAKHSPAWAPGVEPASWPRIHGRRWRH